MNQFPNCPVCSHSSWDVIRTKNYDSSEPPKNLYNSIRNDVLFSLWFPGNPKVSLESIGCEKCGFLCFRPRPDEDNIREKYTYINQHKDGKKEFRTAKKSDYRRAKSLYCYLRDHFTTSPITVLDYGGGNGRLLGEFVANGHNCSVLDLVDETLPGITYLGDSLDALSEVKNFHLIICSHVLEHLVDPLKALKSLSDGLAPDGFLYIEVPSEIWREAPPKIDPVTHINFFTTDSMRTLANIAGLDVVSCKYDEFIRPNGLIGIAIKSVLKKPLIGSTPTIEYRGLRELRRLLYVGAFGRLSRLVKHPRMLANLYRKPE